MQPFWTIIYRTPSGHKGWTEWVGYAEDVRGYAATRKWVSWVAMIGDSKLIIRG